MGGCNVLPPHTVWLIKTNCGRAGWLLLCFLHDLFANWQDGGYTDVGTQHSCHRLSMFCSKQLWLYECYSVLAWLLKVKGTRFSYGQNNIVVTVRPATWLKLLTTLINYYTTY